MDVHRRFLSADPAYVTARDMIENQTLSFLRGESAAARPGVTRIPVVVHVVWNTEQQNVSDEQIASQIEVLNRDFRRTNPDADDTPAPFLPLVADSRLEFFLAEVDPAGQPTTGVQRRQTNVTSFSDDDAIKSEATGGLDAWPAADYLNVWVGQLSGGLLGYAQFPGGLPETDGVVILQSAFGTTGMAAPPFDLGRTTTHEIGHWLNLNHIWGDDGTGCAGTDNVDDTPNQGGSNTGTPTFPNISCGNGPDGDMFMNYMDYVDDAAMFMFSVGQVARMQACLDGPRSTIGTPGVVSPAADHKPSGPVVSWGPDRLDVFMVGPDQGLYHKWWDGSGWRPSATGYEALGGTCLSTPQVISTEPDRLHVFVVGSDQAVYHKRWDGRAWQPDLADWERLGGVCAGGPQIVSSGPDRLDLFITAPDQTLHHKWWDGSSWQPGLTDYDSLGGVEIT